jgi:hypothetical protein
MILGWLRKLWIFSYLINCPIKLSFIILFFYTTFKPTIKPLKIYLAKNTFPNFPCPSCLSILKFYRHNFSLEILFELEGFTMLLRKDGNFLLEWFFINPSVLFVDEESFKVFSIFFLWNLGALKKGFFSSICELLERLFMMAERLIFSTGEYTWCYGW